MATYRHLDHAPLREALVDIQFEAVDLQIVEASLGALQDRYTVTNGIWEAMIRIDTATSPTLPTQSVVGHRLSAINGSPYVLQAKQSGFTLSRLAPYVTWEELRAEAEIVWGAFSAGIDLHITRLAVRYINVLRLPVPFHDFAEYIVSSPQVPAVLPQSLEAFLTRVVMPDPATGATAVVTHVFEGAFTEGPEGHAASVILDIDVSMTCDLSSNSERLWEVLDQLRDQKNRLFFEHITEKSAELYQ